jgi:dTDP-glucose 4,6-dehydratase
MKIVVTGGEGFIGSNFIRLLLGNTTDKEDIQVWNIDRQTYAGMGKNLDYCGISKDSRYHFFWGDIRDKGLMKRVFKGVNPDLVFHFAAESHVDRSIQDTEDFFYTNVGGTISLLEAARETGLEKFVHISTDEVGGSIAPGRKFAEEDKINPSSPYAASKAAAESFALAYHKTHDVPVVIARSSNNYGPFQFPEKLIPLFITNLIQGKKVPLMSSEENPGMNVRDWIHVEDNCQAIWNVAKKGKAGEIYHIPGNNLMSNIEITMLILNYFGMKEDMIERVPHRRGHDLRYSMSGGKLKELGFRPDWGLRQGINATCKWYAENQNWWRPLKA